MSALVSLFHSLTVREWLIAACDILIVYYVIYRTLLLIKGTRAAQMLIGIVLVGAGFFAAKLLELTTLSWLLDNLINYSIIFFIVIFQHDIRRGLMRVGQNLFIYARPYEQTFVFEEVIKATERLATARVGALIVLERDADLVDYLNEPGVEMDSKVSEELLVSLFLPDSENKLHDGAVIIKNLRIAQAGAVLPLSANARLDKALGTRHRAAIGVTEETDAVVVVVSEERGSISLCFGGNIARDLDSPTLRKALLGLFQKQKRRAQSQKAKEREVPAALVELPFEKPQPPEEPDSAPLATDAGEAEDTKRDEEPAAEAKPAESS
ncbi:MAG: diadenylate cyclase CdaA [Polyangia bacterium]